MNFKILSFRAFAIFLGLFAGCVLAGFLTLVLRHDVPWRSLAFRHASSFQKKNYMYIQSPFYFPFQTRPTSMYVAEGFSEDPENKARHNSQGFRTPEYTFAHPPDTFRILVIGDSFTWGQGVPLEDTFPRLLAGLLNRSCPNSHFEVISLGIRGHRLADNLMKLKIHGAFLHPDLVIIQLCTNDLDFFDYFTILNLQKVSNPSRLYRMKEVAVHEPNSLDWKVFIESLDELRNWSFETHIPVSFVAFPPLDAGRNGRNFHHYDPKKLESFPEFSEFSKVLEEIRQRNFPILYLIDIFRQRAADEYLALSETDGHPNALAHRLSAQALSTFLFEKKLIDCKQAVPPNDPGWEQENILRKQAADSWFEFHRSYAKQLDFFLKLRKIYPENPWIAMQLGNVYYRLGISQRAFDLFASLLSMIPQYAAPWYDMARSSSSEEQRVILSRRMLRAVPDHTNSMRILLDYYLRLHETHEACILLGKLKSVPDSSHEFASASLSYEQNHCDQKMQRVSQ